MGKISPFNWWRILFDSILASALTLLGFDGESKTGSRVGLKQCLSVREKQKIDYCLISISDTLEIFPMSVLFEVEELCQRART